MYKYLKKITFQILGGYIMSLFEQKTALSTIWISIINLRLNDKSINMQLSNWSKKINQICLIQYVCQFNLIIDSELCD